MGFDGDVLLSKQEGSIVIRWVVHHSIIVGIHIDPIEVDGDARESDFCVVLDSGLQVQRKRHGLSVSSAIAPEEAHPDHFKRRGQVGEDNLDVGVRDDGRRFVGVSIEGGRVHNFGAVCQVRVVRPPLGGDSLLGKSPVQYEAGWRLDVTRSRVAHIEVVGARSRDRLELHADGVESLKRDVGLEYRRAHCIETFHPEPPIGSHLGLIVDPSGPPEASDVERHVRELDILSPLEREALVETLLNGEVPDVEV